LATRPQITMSMSMSLSHAAMHPCRTSHTAAAQRPAPSPRTLAQPAPSFTHGFFVHRCSSFTSAWPSPSQPHPSRVQPRCRQPACHWPGCRFVRVSGAQRQRALMCASLHARATASLQRSPQASPYHRHPLCTPRCPQPLVPPNTKHHKALPQPSRLPPQLHHHPHKPPLPCRPSTRPTAYLSHDPRCPILARPARPLLALPCRHATPAARPPPPRRRPTPARFLASSCNPLTCP
jgi:hypothetical protein